VVEPCGAIVAGALGIGAEGAAVEGAAAGAGAVAVEEGEALATRGLGGMGSFSSTTNAAGGEVFTSTGDIVQSDFEGIVNSGLYKGDVNILTGVHGLPSGTMIPEAGFLSEDVGAFGQIPGVNIYNIPSMTPGEISSVLNSPGTTIGAFCNSGACLAPFQ
jgi:hypothetical protein